MEYLRSGPIVAAENSTPLEWRRAVAIARDIAAALALAHAQGIVHRDVKPANVMLGADNRAKLADFGLARAVAEESIALTSAGAILGTPAYLAPEVIEGQEATPLSDIYSLGVLLYRLSTGRPPFDASSAAAVLRGHLEGRFPKVTALAPGVPAELDRVIAGCTARDPEARYPGAEFVGEDLEHLLKGEIIVGPPEKAAPFAIEVPFWARFIPGAERTIVAVKTEVAAAEKRAREASRLEEETEALARGLEEQAAGAERNAAGWRSVAERALEEGREEEAREALGHALQFDGQAETYRVEIEKTRAAAREAREAAMAARADAEEAAVKGRLLLNRRDRARLLLGRAWQPGRRVYVAAGIGLIAVLALGAAFLLLRTSEPLPSLSRRRLETRDRVPVGGLSEGAFPEFQEQTSVSSEFMGLWLCTADIDSDGFPDLVLPRFGASKPGWAKNDGAGGFGEWMDFGAVMGSHAPVFFDADGDGDLDAFFIANYGDQNDAGLLLNDGHGNFTASDGLPVPPAGARRPIVFDADGDGSMDLFIPCGDPHAAGERRARNALFLNDGSGRFRDASSSHLPDMAAVYMDAVAGDIDGDGDLDLVIVVDNSPPILLKNSGAGVFRADDEDRWIQGEAPVVAAIVLVDCDNDGDLDMIVQPATVQALPDRLFLNNGSGIFQENRDRMPGTPTSMSQTMVGNRVADLNSDGYPEVLFPGVRSMAMSRYVPAAIYSCGKTGIRDVSNAVFGSREMTRIQDIGSGAAGYALPTSYAATFEDLDRDGNVDILVLLMDPDNDRVRVRIWKNMARDADR
jgi:hypothetical protein